MSTTTPVGTLAYLIQEEALLVRVNNGWQYLSVSHIIIYLSFKDFLKLYTVFVVNFPMIAGCDSCSLTTDMFICFINLSGEFIMIVIVIHEIFVRTVMSSKCNCYSWVLWCPWQWKPLLFSQRNRGRHLRQQIWSTLSQYRMTVLS